jgi:PEP-CTERM motif
MKVRIASLTIFCLALAAAPAFADYDNGPINGTTDAWTINFGYVVSDRFFFSEDDREMTGFSIGVWEFPGDSVTSVDWSITGSENAPCPGELCQGNGTAQVTDKFISTNQFGYNIDLLTATFLIEAEGGPYWLNLQNAVVPSGDPVYWDENSGKGCTGTNCPSIASESAVGTIPSEAFTVYAECVAGPCGPTPEPGSIMLFGSGILGLAGVLRRKLF